MQNSKEKAKNIKLVIFDVDGVFTDGSFIYNHEGEELKSFSTQDGMGIRLLQKAGIEIGIISGRDSVAVSTRMQNLNIQFVYQGRSDKQQAFDEIKTKLNLTNDEIAYVGDDLPDLSFIRQAGLGIAVANAVAILHEHADMSTTATGGQGAVREICEFILESQGKLSQILKAFL